MHFMFTLRILYVKIKVLLESDSYISGIQIMHTVTLSIDTTMPQLGVGKMKEKKP